jgi:hypothetical protein
MGYYPPGTPINNTYYDHMAAKYQGGVRGTPYRDPRAPAYPSYLNEEYLYGPTGHPYVQHVPHPYEGSPGHVQHYVQPPMHSPHMQQYP